ncbi:hypothetical protein INR49_007087, partial [Caranx melampygus]
SRPDSASGCTTANSCPHLPRCHDCLDIRGSSSGTQLNSGGQSTWDADPQPPSTLMCCSKAAGFLSWTLLPAAHGSQCPAWGLIHSCLKCPDSDVPVPGSSIQSVISPVLVSSVQPELCDLWRRSR